MSISVLENVAIVLCRPKYAGNVGSAARGAMNMGIERLVVVGGKDLNPQEMKQMSTHFAAPLIDNIVYCETVEEALADFGFAVGTTARLGNARGPALSPREAAQKVAAAIENNDCALLFGPEDTGLTNEELRLCHAVASIPSSPRFRSLNLSQAVMIMCYEVFLAAGGERKRFMPQLATSSELEGMYGQISELLQRIGFLNPENPEYWMMHLRRLLARTELQSKEVKIIRGICRQLAWYAENKKT
ncbi:MAG: RNA methyltransferase [Smithellaceae bacterium]|nr:RNA methyltransferase [Smithellaceae bacterium]